LNPGIQFLSHEVSEPFNGSYILEIKGLNKSFGGIHAIRGLDLTLKRGELVGLIGPNGSGKTTFTNLISGLLKPDAGVINFKGEQISGLPPNLISLKGIGRTFQIVKVFTKMTVQDNLTVAGFSRLEDIGKLNAQVNEILKFLKLEHLKNQYAGNISGGQQKLLELGRVLMFNPELFILDEPFVGIHPEIRMQIYELIEMANSMGKTFILISHDMKSIFRISSRIVVLSSGAKIADSDPNSVRNNQNVLDAYLGD
jgi:branched-chain amino acid transport system ATP-binding protein